MKNFNIGYPVGYSTPEEVMAYLGFNVMERYTVPQIIWIDRKGNIRSQTTSAGDDASIYTEGYWRNMIETLLKEPATADASHYRGEAAPGRVELAGAAAIFRFGPRCVIIATERP